MLRAWASPRSPTSPRETMKDLFVSSTDVHRKVLHVMVRNNPSLMSGSLLLLVNNARVLDFDNKRNYSNQQLHKCPHSHEHHGTLQLNVHPQRVFEDSFQSLQRKTGRESKSSTANLAYDSTTRRAWMPRVLCGNGSRSLRDRCSIPSMPCFSHVRPIISHTNPTRRHESIQTTCHFRVIGKAMYDGRPLDPYFARSLYRQVLGKPVDYRDVEWIDPEYYNSLCRVLEDDPSPLDLNFSVEGDEVR